MENKLPEGWKITNLEYICNLVTDGTHDKTPLVDQEIGVPLVTSKDLTEDGISFENVIYIKKEQHQQIIRRSKPENGDILYSKIGTIGKPTIVDVDLEFSIKNVALFKLKEDIVFNKYIRYYLKCEHVHNSLLKRADGGNQKFIPINALKKIEIILPPLETQQKIVSILEKAEETKKLRVQADELTQKLLQSVFLEMFGDPVKNPKNWDVEKVQDVISSIEAGWSANGEQRPREENEYAVLKVSAVTQGIFLPEECKVINKDIEFKKVVTPEKRDILFSRANTLELVGASCLIRENHPYLLLPDKLWKIKVNEEKICPEYFKFVLSSTAIRSEISKRSTGTSGSMYNISMNKLKLIAISVPPIEIQKKFSIIVETIEKTKDFEKQSSIEINNLFDALMQKAFTGELVA